MILMDYHLHSEFSGDSTQDLNELIEIAIKLGLKEIAITDHFEYGMEGLSEAWRIDLTKYTNKILELKEKYKTLISIKLGLEVGVQPHTKEYIENKIGKYSFDFIIASGHAINGKDISFGEIQFGKTKDEVQTMYFKNLLENVKIYSQYSVYGHLDFITRYGGSNYRGLNYNFQRELIDEILKVIIANGKGIEINTSGFRYNEDRFYPHTDILKRYFELGGEIITVGSDAHVAKNIAKDFIIVYDFLKSINQKYICSFEDMKPSFIKI